MAFVARMALLMMVCVACAAATTTPPDEAAVKRWAAAHPAVQVVLDDQLGGEVAGGEANPLVTEYLKLASRNTGVKFETFKVKSWAEAVKAFRDGRADVLPSLSDRLLTADAGPGVILSTPFYVGRTLIISRTVGPEKLDLYALKGRTVAFRKGGAYEEWLRREHPEIQRVPLDDIVQVLAAVESGIAYAAVGVDVSYYPIIRRDYPLTLHVAGDVPEMPITVRVAVRADQPELLALVQGALEGIGDGENKRIVERWLQTVYLRAPTLAQIIAIYRTQLLIGGGLLLFSLYWMRRAQLISKRSEKQKTMLLAVVSHEVRNAVNAVTSSIDLLGRTSLDGPQRDLMAIAASSSRNLQDMLRNALDFARNESAGFTPDLDACDAYAVAREVLHSHRVALEGKGVETRLQLPLGPLPWLLLDSARLRQVLDNLVGNAVKFTTKGHVGVSLWQDDGGTASDHVRRLYVEVSDSGEGIPDAMQRTVFKAFGQAHGARSRRLGGAGLGLAVCRDIVSQLGGTLELTSAVGVGTTVRLILPTSLVPAEDGEEDAWHGDDEAAGEGMVLLVEDHPANRQVLAAQLRHLGYEVVTAGDGREAIDRFGMGDIEAVLLDCELPDMPGYDVARELRAIEGRDHTGPVKLVAISANTGEEHVRRCEAAGIDVVLGKPLDLPALRRALSDPFDIGQARETFRVESRADLQHIRRALDQGERADASRAAHRMRGGALICGVTDVAEALDELEALLRSPEADVDALHALLERIETML